MPARARRAPRQQPKKGQRPKPGSAMTTSAPVEIHDSRYCGGKRRQGPGLCTRPAGWGTDHVGQGKCKLHGGANPIRHGRYSTIQRPRIRALIEQFEADPNPLSTLAEIAFVRALLQDFVERYEENAAAIVAWHLSFSVTQRPLSEEKVLAFERLVDDMEERYRTHKIELTDAQLESLALARAFLADLKSPDNTRPRQLLDVSDAYRMAGEVSKMVERIQKTQAANAVSRGDLLRILSEMGRIVDIYVTDDPTRDKIRDGWREIRL